MERRIGGCTKRCERVWENRTISPRFVASNNRPISSTEHFVRAWFGSFVGHLADERG